METEVWKYIPGFDNKYLASNYGRIKSLIKNRVLSPFLNNCGYEMVSLTKDKQSKHYLVHRLVWLAFNGDIPQGLVVNHIDENRQNNFLGNLNLLTDSENINWGTANKRRSISLKESARRPHITEEKITGLKMVIDDFMRRKIAEEIKYYRQK